ncbi:MAG: YggS family pyridoxal phosphate-dependent enzyme [Oscillospiraceae bacterium]
MNNEVCENYKRALYNVQEAKAKYRKSSESVRLMVVTKTVPAEIVNDVIDCGADLLGENRVQEYLEKKDIYKPAEVHFIGHLQSNKIKYIINSVECIHSVDSLDLAKEISKAAVKNGKVMKILAEVNIGEEESKFGISPEKLDELIYGTSELPGIKLCGLMTIPPKGNSEAYFEKMQELFIETGNKNVKNVSMDILSMGMSADYVEAIKYGSNIVRIGSGIFGARK